MVAGQHASTRARVVESGAGAQRVLDGPDIGLTAGADPVAITVANPPPGWYVLEQDLMLKDGEPAGEGPIAGVRRCPAFVEQALAQ